MEIEWKKFNRSSQPDLFQRVLITNRHGRTELAERANDYDDLLGVHDFWNVAQFAEETFNSGVLHRDDVVAFAELPRYKGD